jgi:ATP-dependent DNA helicase RecG
MQLLDIKGLGQKSVEKLAHFNIFSPNDLLLHLPFRYQNKTQFSELSNLVVGDEVLLRLVVESIEVVGFGVKSMLLVHLLDSNQQQIIARFFHFSQFQRQQFIRGSEVECFGEIKITRLGLEMHHPEYRIISANQSTLLRNTLTPVYHTKEGITQNQLRAWITVALDDYNNNNVENTEFKNAVNMLHHPHKDDDLDAILNFTHPVQQQLIIQEFASRKLALLQARQKIRTQNTTPLIRNNSLIKKIKLDFALTNAQKRVLQEIETDIASTKPMLRLLQGDVGCGKTIVAALISLIAIESGKQVAILSPTAILSTQHQESFEALFTPLGITIAFLISSQTSTQRRKNLDLIKNDADIIIGTHSIFQKEVIFRDLGLIIIDEQHKFGVEQRLQLRQKAQQSPHLLAMSATPIPRSLMMSIYGEMDISIIDELPKGRKKVQTLLINADKKEQVATKIQEVCNNGQQVYWVCVLIEDSENFNATPAIQSFEFLTKALPLSKVALVHSKISKQEKEQIMQDFAGGNIDVLVATTVIEVGVNVPNASVMIIENAEKLGLASLHQLRGRVGRGSSESFCMLLYGNNLSDNAKQRLETLRSTNDGFEIAKKDLELRGVGEVLGVNQSGIANFKIANLVRDEYLLEQANNLAKEYIAKDKTTQDEFMSFWVHDKNQELVTS